MNNITRASALAAAGLWVIWGLIGRISTFLDGKVFNWKYRVLSLILAGLFGFLVGQRTDSGLVIGISGLLAEPVVKLLRRYWSAWVLNKMGIKTP